MLPEIEAASETTSPARLRILARSSTVLARIVAANPAAPIDLLRRLAIEPDRTIKQAVASNLSTPIKDLIKLGVLFPNEVLEHPTFRQLLLEINDESHDNLRYAIENMLRLPELEEDFIILAFLVRAFPLGEPMHELARIERMGFQGSTREFLFSFAEHRGGFLREFAQTNPNKPIKMKVTFARGIYYENCRTFEFTNNTPIEFIEALASDRDEWFRSIAAQIPNTPFSILKNLAADEIRSVRQDVASNPNVPISLLKILARDRDADVRGSAASNPNMPSKYLTILARDRNWYVRSCVAKNPKASIEILKILACDESNLVLKEVSQRLNRKMSIEQLTNLARSLIRNKDDRAYYLLAMAEKLPNNLLKTLAREGYWVARASLAKNLHTSKKWLKILARDRDKEVRRNVAQNPNTPAASLEILANDRGEYRSSF
jgi:Leucine rich repeat variant